MSRLARAGRACIKRHSLWTLASLGVVGDIDEDLPLEERQGQMIVVIASHGYHHHPRLLNGRLLGRQRGTSLPHQIPAG